MKKISIFMAAAAMLFAFAGCEPEEQKVTEEPVSKDKISIAPQTKTFTPEGGSQPVMVTSSTDWTVTPAEEYDWISVDPVSGTDGDVVTFNVNPNATGKQLTAKFTFKAGDAEAIFTAISQSSDPVVLKLVSDADMEISHESARITVEVETNLSYRTLVPSVGDADWITFNAALESENGATLYFDVKALEGMDSRETVITISDPDNGCEPVSVNLKQRAMPVITPEKAEYFISLDDTSLEIPVTANVEYEVAVEGDWLTYAGNEGGVEKFTFSTATERREATVTMTEKSPLGEAAPVVATVSVLQREAALVTSAINFSNARIFPEEWNNAQPLQYMEALTIEALVRPDNFEKGGSGTLSTIMGIEGQFLVRVGDAGVPNNQLQIATSAGNYTDAALQLNTGEWYHIAVSYDKNTHKIQVYINGELKMDSYTSFVSTVNFGVARGNETGAWGSVVRVFWIGYAYAPERDFEGLMTELRIWDRALTAEEIQAENHFYTVDPSSEGLVAYWKCNEGQGTTVKDYSASGNDLTGQVGLHQEGSGNNTYTTGDTQINWVEVSLP